MTLPVGLLVQAAEVDGELLVDEDPHVVVAEEGERRRARVLEPVARLRREAEVVRRGPALPQPSAVEREEASRSLPYWNAPPAIGGSVSVWTIVLLYVALSTYHMPNQSTSGPTRPVGAGVPPGAQLFAVRMAG